MAGARVERTVVIASTDAVPTGQQVTDPGLPFPTTSGLVERLAGVSRSADNRFLDAAGLAEGLLGSTTNANILTLGAAVQSGAVPIPVEAIERAIELNGVTVAKNHAAFAWGRAWVDNPAEVEVAAGLPTAVEP